MIALDSNVVIRFLVADDAKQAARVRQLLDGALKAGESCLISDGVLCEIEWVLESVYRAGRSDIAGAIQRLLSNHLFAFEDAKSVRQGLELYRAGKADLSDYLIGLRARSTGARTTYTFDRSLRGVAEFTLL